MKKIQFLSRDQIQERLKELESRKSPQPKMGACCYSMSEPPKYAEYICPGCGEKTLYIRDHAMFIAWELESCRREFNFLKASTDISLKLDESSYCGKCSPDATTFQLTLTVTYGDETAVTSAPISENDLRILGEFFKGKLSYKTFTDGSRPLKDVLHILRELLVEGRSPFKSRRRQPKTTGGRVSPDDNFVIRHSHIRNETVDVLEKLRADLFCKVRESVKNRTDDFASIESCFEIDDNVPLECNQEWLSFLNDQERETLHNIDMALCRIQDGEYGICEECGKDIPLGRLKALPFTCYCVNCKSHLEKLQEQTKTAKELSGQESSFVEVASETRR